MYEQLKGQFALVGHLKFFAWLPRPLIPETHQNPIHEPRHSAFALYMSRELQLMYTSMIPLILYPVIHRIVCLIPKSTES
jgi:hypothetical protein